MSRSIHVFGGGTIQHVRSHFALCAPAYGSLARKFTLLARGTLLQRITAWLSGKPLPKVHLHLTKMADSTSKLETNQDVADQVQKLLQDPNVGAIIFNVALCDYAGQVGSEPSGKYATRLSSRDGDQAVNLTPADKILPAIRAARPDVFIVGFKTTAGDTHQRQHEKAYRQMQETGVDIVWVNDVVTRENRIYASNLRIDETTLKAGNRQEHLAWLVKTVQQTVRP